jgi:hypothetical protein
LYVGSPSPWVCPHCGVDMCVVALVTEAFPVQPTLTQSARQAEPLLIAAKPGLTAWDVLVDAVPGWDA